MSWVENCHVPRGADITGEGVPTPKPALGFDHLGMAYSGAAHSMIGDARLDAATNAALAPIVDRFLPDTFEKLPEATFGERYKHALDIQNGKDHVRGGRRIAAMALRQAEAC
jgi:hypothetical protein